MRTPLFLLIAAALLVTSCHPREMIMRKVMTDNADYFDAPDMQGSELVKHTAHVWSFRWTWYRSVVIETSEGLVVTDPFNDTAATALAAALAKQFPGKPIHTLLYSHYHLDHARGGAKLPAPKQILAHEKCPGYWKAAGATDVLAPTQLLEGKDQTLTIGGIEIQLLFTGQAHSDTNFAVFVPAERVLWVADMNLVKAYPPFGGPDHYAPGYMTALDRLATLEFDHYLPSHFGTGNKKDFLEGKEHYEFHRRIAREAIAKIGPPRDKKSLGAHFDYIYPRAKERYGDWRGFDDHALQLLIRQESGELLGY